MRWIIGDIHGMLRPLRALVDATLERDPEAQFFFAGDYVNRGPESRGVVDYLIGLPGSRFCRGNHDEVFNDILNGLWKSDGPEQEAATSGFLGFLEHGLYETLLSYGVEAAHIDITWRRPTLSRIREMCDRVPRAHRDFFAKLEWVIEAPDFFIAHAYWPPLRRNFNPPIARQIVDEPSLAGKLLWTRFDEREIFSRKAWDRPGYFGHTPVPNYSRGVDFTPIAGDHIVLLDTASALDVNGQLSAVCADTGDVLQAGRSGGIRSS